MTLSLRHDGGENSSKGENPAPLHWRLPDAARPQSFAKRSMFLRTRYDKGAPGDQHLEKTRSIVGASPSVHEHWTVPRARAKSESNAQTALRRS